MRVVIAVLHTTGRKVTCDAQAEDPVPRLLSAASSPAGALAAAGAEAAAGQASPGSDSSGGTAPAPLPADHHADEGRPAAADHASPSAPAYLRRWNALREAALAGARTLQQALPTQPRFVHFGNYCTLTQLSSAKQAAAIEQPLDAQPAAER